VSIKRNYYIFIIEESSPSFYCYSLFAAVIAAAAAAVKFENEVVEFVNFDLGYFLLRH
jgi:hypothetical protein